ncbi:hypothetical protein CBR_g40551 [Chara braunii]|uniref:Uncharacterized protein n=1 Tax=Chara braunii TaxID=69332 RepID=A0A388K2C6_CHABU|nr:hypothetical protein CBR_g40551 [Chara braunii]|eukprot:GBG64103.1 hypothetical protein CBR_g40551 [Chara braunii]
MRRIAPREYEAVKRIKEESDSRGSFLVKMRKAYPLEVQRQKKKQLLQELGLWIGKGGEKIERRARKEDRRNIRVPQLGNDEDKAHSGNDSIKEDKTQMEGHHGKEEEGNGKAGEVKKGDEKVKGKEKDSEKNEVVGPSGTTEEPISNESPKERGTRRWKEEKRQRKEKENREWRNWDVASLRENELPTDAHWTLKLERMLLFETVISSKLATDMDRLIRLNELLRDDCEWILEGEAEVDGRLRKVEEERRRALEGVANHVPEILKETQRLRAREEKRDMQWAKVEKEMEGLKAEVKKAKIEQGKLEVKVKALSIALDNKSKEAETEKMEKEKLEKEVGKLEANASEQGKAIEESKKKLENEKWEKVEEALKQSK